MLAFIASACLIASQIAAAQQRAPLPPTFSIPKRIHDPVDVRPIPDTCPINKERP